MSALTADELVQMRADLETLLPDTCNLLTVTQAADGQGGYTDTWGTATTNLACRLDNSGRTSGNTRSVSGDSLRPFSSWILTVPQDTTLTTAYRVEHGGNTYSVTSVSAGGSWLGVKRAQLERL